MSDYMDIADKDIKTPPPVAVDGEHVTFERGRLIVHLYPWENEQATAVGAARTAANLGRANAPHYNSDLMEDNDVADRAAALCERAVAVYTGRYWWAHVWPQKDHGKYKHLPDVGDNIEVRRVRTQSGPAVRRRELGSDRVLWAARVLDADAGTVELLGWIGVDEGWAQGSPATYDKTNNTHVVPVSALSLLLRANSRQPRAPRKTPGLAGV